MNIWQKIVITDTNIITDLDNAKLLDIFIKLDNVYMCDVVVNDEINSKSASFSISPFIKKISFDETELEEVMKLMLEHRKLSFYDLANYVSARTHNGVLATGDERLKKFAEENGVEVIRTLKIIEYLYNCKIIENEKFIKSLELLKNNDKTRIPKEEIEKLENKYREKLIA